jgi:hypothetical protein
VAPTVTDRIRKGPVKVGREIHAISTCAIFLAILSSATETECTHDGAVVTLESNLRRCSHGFTIRCWNGDAVQVLFSLDCCDREAMGWLATSGGGA